MFVPFWIILCYKLKMQKKILRDEFWDFVYLKLALCFQQVCVNYMLCNEITLNRQTIASSFQSCSP